MTTQCPCARPVSILNRVTGDVVFCPCGRSLLVQHRGDGTTVLLPVSALIEPEQFDPLPSMTAYVTQSEEA